MRYLKTYIALSFLIGIISCNGGNTGQQNSNKNGIGGSTFKLGVALYSFRQSPFGQSLEEAKESGVKYVEGFSFQKLGSDFNNEKLLKLSDDQLKKMKKMLRKRGLKMLSLYAAVKTRLEWEKCFEIGDRLGLSFLVGEPKRALLDFLDSLAGVHGMRLAIHQHAQGESIYWHPDSVLTACQGRPNIGACVDLGHWERSGVNIMKGLKELEGHIISLHAKNVNKEGDLNAEWVAINKGAINYKKILKELDRQNFNGVIYVEDERKGDNLNHVQSAIKYLKELRNK